ncbi:uncharacterized protein F4822DRAFT_414037 [Hypoxylon trugodes]|uniref:uncharacterized protein n=1 Tax=Hypoxylon trugodes TaxID=326681 RepID=UPI00219733B7|nr:uncharacterized protein F4822DRAFT_414037 [Hypoxylon trugodes]KAI1385738.1 hypothetical protein F4822DRAFT_414037 [Hypoxylon trugodes]
MSACRYLRTLAAKLLTGVAIFVLIAVLAVDHLHISGVAIQLGGQACGRVPPCFFLLWFSGTGIDDTFSISWKIRTQATFLPAWIN